MAKKHLWTDAYPDTIEWNAPLDAKPVYTLLDKAAARFPDRLAVDFLGQELDYKTLHQQSEQLAAYLQKIGIKKGDRVGLFMPNSAYFVVSYFAILRLGAVVVNFNPLYTKDELAPQFEATNLALVIALDIKFLFEKLDFFVQKGVLKRVLVAEFAQCLPRIKSCLYRLFKRKDIARVSYDGVRYFSSKKAFEVPLKPIEPPAINLERDTAVLQFTGGTTGQPKAAQLTHENIYINACQVGHWFGGLEEGKETIIGVLPLFHIFAMTVVMNLAVLKGCKMQLYPRFDLKQLLKDIRRKKPTVLPAIPTLFSAVNQYDKVSSYDLSSLKSCIAGGAPLPVEVKQKFEKKTGCNLIEGYGLTESSPVAMATPLFGLNKPGSAGLPMPGTIISIRDAETGKELPQGETGEICVEGPQVMFGYLDDSEATKATMWGEALRTGDLGYLDEDGYCYIVDRLKEMIIVSGFNVYPSEVEAVFYEHPAIAEVAVLGIDDDYQGQAIKAVIALKPKFSASEEELHSFCKEKLVGYKRPTIIEIRDELPKTMIGKIDKKSL